ncbi:MAG: GNAT family N-acetyltransferase [Clostridiales bacterium]|nr:GNAT family N-acetyltransferase [Clostridiales bacterium]
MNWIKKLELEELQRIYNNHVIEDFPRNERRPLFSMEKLMKTGKYECFGYCDDGSLLAYAFYFLAESRQYALLDYFAVVPGLRGHGTGSEFLRLLKGAVSAKNGVFIEAENPDSAKSEEEATLRRRRIRFYRSNGAALTNAKAQLFGVDYDILYIGLNGTDLSIKQLDHAAENLYREVYRPIYGRFCKLYTEDKSDEN